MLLKKLYGLAVNKDFYNLPMYCPATAKNKLYFDEY